MREPIPDLQHKKRLPKLNFDNLLTQRFSPLKHKLMRLQLQLGK